MKLETTLLTTFKTIIDIVVDLGPKVKQSGIKVYLTIACASNDTVRPSDFNPAPNLHSRDIRIAVGQSRDYRKERCG